MLLLKLIEVFPQIVSERDVFHEPIPSPVDICLPLILETCSGM